MSINPEKFQDFMAWLQRLDLSNVELSLWEVYFDPVFKESAKIQENLEVGNTTKTKNLEVTNDATIKYLEAENAKIDTITWNTTFNKLATFNQWANISDLDVPWTSTLNNTSLTGSTTVERFDGEVYLSDDVRIGGDLDVAWSSNFQWPITAHDIHATDHLELPASSWIKIGGVNFEDWLVSYGNAHWQPR